jgi:hypothetical protein
MDSQAPNFPNILHLTLDQLQQRYWRTLDPTVPHTLYRWVAFGGMFLLYFLRVWVLQGFYVVTYALGIHILNLFIGFITPQVRIWISPWGSSLTKPRGGLEVCAFYLFGDANTQSHPRFPLNEEKFLYSYFSTYTLSLRLFLLSYPICRLTRTQKDPLFRAMVGTTPSLDSVQKCPSLNFGRLPCGVQ